MTSDGHISTEFERYENGSRAAEQELIDGLVTKVGFLQHINRDPRTGTLHRGTHGKGILCRDAEFEVLDVAAANPGVPAAVIATLRQGLYRAPARYAARARFANGVSRKGDDTEPDERALSFSVDVGDGARQDYSMNSADLFPIVSLAAFNVVFMISLIRGVRAGLASDDARRYVSSRLKRALAPRALLGLPDVVRTLRNAVKVTHRQVKSFRQTAYWSGTAFRHGDHDAIKYMAVPCDGEVLGPPANPAPNYLQDDLREWVNTQRRSVSFDLRLQLLDVESMRHRGRRLPAWRWVEDSSIDWQAAGARDYLVARLTIRAGSIADDSDDPAIFPAFDVTGNSVAEHRPLGRINRGRAVVEVASRHNRG